MRLIDRAAMIVKRDARPGGFQPSPLGPGIEALAEAADEELARRDARIAALEARLAALEAVPRG